MKISVAAIKNKITGRSKQARDYIEYRRLKRIRKYQTPQYSNCMNCGEKLQGMYCHKCGQYALDVKQGMWVYLKQFAENTYQFDGKIVQTLRFLVFNPGFLSCEFLKGKINSYVHPMRLYMFLSVVFFSFVLVLFSNVNVYDKFMANNKELQKELSLENIAEDKLNKDSLNQEVASAEMQKQLSKTNPLLNLDLLTKKQDSNTDSDEIRRKSNLIYREAFAHISKYMPILLLLLIPVYGGILYFCYRKTHPDYMSHIVFAFHVHSFFLLLLCIDVLLIYYQSWDTAILVSAILYLLYNMLAARTFYRRNWFSSVFRTSVNLFLYGMVLFFALIGLTAWMAMTIIKELEAGLL